MRREFTRQEVMRMSTSELDAALKDAEQDFYEVSNRYPYTDEFLDRAEHVEEFPEFDTVKMLRES